MLLCCKFEPDFVLFSYYIFQNTVFFQSNDIGWLIIKRRTVQSLKAAQTMKNEQYSAQKVDLVMGHVFLFSARGTQLNDTFSAKACMYVCMYVCLA
jgi:hypothetical protein